VLIRGSSDWSILAPFSHLQVCPGPAAGQHLETLKSHMWLPAVALQLPLSFRSPGDAARRPQPDDAARRRPPHPRDRALASKAALPRTYSERLRQHIRRPGLATVTRGAFSPQVEAHGSEGVLTLLARPGWPRRNYGTGNTSAV